MFLTKVVEKNQVTHFMFSNFFSENRSVYEIMSKTMVEPERPHDIDHAFRMLDK
jgi:hypothetical protein